MRGEYSGTPTTLALDSAGRILAHLIGLDGVTPRDVALDADGNLNARLKGLDGSTLRDVALDSTGQLYARMVGLYNSTLKTIAVDTDGVMKANLSAQDFDFLRVRPVYGQARAGAKSPVSIDTLTWGTLVDVTGRGATYPGGIYWNATSTSTASLIELTIDGVEVFEETITTMDNKDFDKEWLSPFKIVTYDNTQFIYCFAIRPELTFEDSFKIRLYNAGEHSITVSRFFYYALVPA
jgi:hypothetical protein